MKKTDVTQPVAMASAFADGVYSATSTSDFEIPAATSTSADDTCVLDDGFLPITSTALDDGGIAPERKNFNGMFYLSTDQRFYLQNGGYITYNPAVASAIGGYPQDAILAYINSFGTYKLVKSLIDDNTNNFVADETLIDGTHWEEIQMGGNTRNIGEVVVSSMPLTDAGLHLLDGALISGSGSYSAFVDYIADLYNSGDYPARFTTEANWQASVASNGLCSQFVYDSVNNTVRLPKWGNIAYTKQYTLTLASTVPVRGNGIAIGLTNGTTSGALCDWATAGYMGISSDQFGSAVGTARTNSTNSNKALGVTTDASKSGLVANTSGVAGLTNDPLACYYYIVIATSTKTDIEVDIDEIATDLNGKADVDLTNLANTGKIAVAHNAMPSGTCKDMTLGATGASYTAPADGYFYGTGIYNGGVSYTALYRVIGGRVMGNRTPFYYTTSTSLGLWCELSVSKGDTVYFAYQNVTSPALYFAYAIGSESEAS